MSPSHNSRDEHKRQTDPDTTPCLLWLAVVPHEPPCATVEMSTSVCLPLTHASRFLGSCSEVWDCTRIQTVRGDPR